MTTDYDRISADDLSCQTEDRLDHTEGEQTTETVKGRAKRTKGAAKKSPAKTSPAKKSIAKSGVRKTAAHKSSAQKTPVKKSVKKATAKTSSAKTASPRPKTATKADVRAQAKQRAEDQLVLRQRIEAIFEDGTSQTAKDRAAQKRAAKAEAKGLVWTLSALALAACGGGNVRFESGARLTTTILSQTERDGGTVRVGDAAADAAGLNDDTIMDVDFRETGTFTVETARIPSDMMVAVEVGGIVDPTTGIQNGGAGADRFVLNLNGTGTTTVTDFESSEGDRVRVDTSAGDETSLRELGLAVQNDNGNAQIVNANDANEIYMILNITSHQDVIDNFSSYFEIV